MKEIVSLIPVYMWPWKVIIETGDPIMMRWGVGAYVMEY